MLRLPADRDGEPDFVKVPNNPPGHTWDIVLTTAENPHGWGVSRWSLGIGVEGQATITDISTYGTAGCYRGIGPPCLRIGAGFERTEITGPPDGEGPQTEDNAGALCVIVLKFDGVVQLPAEGEAVICKLRVSAEFPPTEGEVVGCRVFFAARTGSTGFPTPVELGAAGSITPEEGDPPLTVQVCEFWLKAAFAGPFRRCDPNDDGKSDISDAVQVFRVLFRGGVSAACPAAVDCDGDGHQNITDGIYALLHLFNGGPPPRDVVPRLRPRRRNGPEGLLVRLDSMSG